MAGYSFGQQGLIRQFHRASGGQHRVGYDQRFYLLSEERRYIRYEYQNSNGALIFAVSGYESVLRIIRYRRNLGGMEVPARIKSY